ncbi:N/A [soil metagenome]
MAATNEIEGTSEAVQTLKREIARTTRTKSVVLITGPTGSGKELVARAIHLANRSQGPFFAFTVTDYPPDLLDKALFGSVRGSYTGATQDAEGACGAANGGTLFLDEIGDMPLALQAKLLRLLQEQTYRPIGSTKERILEARIVAATNVDLPRAVKEGQFREDLFFRLRFNLVRAPALDERRADIPLIARSFAFRHSGDTHTFDDDALALLAALPWPGNVRDLEGAITRLVSAIDHRPITIDDVRSIHDVPAPVDSASLLAAAFGAIKPTKKQAADAYDAYVLRVVDAHGGNLAAAARALDCEREYLRKRLHMIGWRRPASKLRSV